MISHEEVYLQAQKEADEDVYKRQAYYVYTFVELKLILQYAFYFSIVTANDYNMLIIMAVSYTHLDVYKRQV